MLSCGSGVGFKRMSKHIVIGNRNIGHINARIEGSVLMGNPGWMKTEIFKELKHAKDFI